MLRPDGVSLISAFSVRVCCCSEKKLDSIYAVADDAEEDAGDQDGEDELWLCVMPELSVNVKAMRQSMFILVLHFRRIRTSG